METGIQYINAIHYKTGNRIIAGIINGVIKEVKETTSVSDVGKELFIAPGLIDNQINGYAGVDFSGDDLSAAGVLAATIAINKDGVTSFLPAITTNSHNNLIRNLRILDEACRSDKSVSDSVVGIHLEGPYISPDEGFRGCHPLKYIRKPSWSEFQEYRKASGGRIIQVTIAPELDGAMEFIKLCVSEGIFVALGHSSASAETILNAVDQGASLSTHLGNGCANFIHRHNNPIWPQLANDTLIATIIADGLHLNSDELKVFLRAKGVDNIVLTSDVVYLAGMTPGKYSFMGADVVLTDDGMLLNTEMNCLAGASFPLKAGVENMIKFTGCSVPDAIKMASENAARVYKLNDRGAIAPGKRADIILFEMTGNKMNIKQVILNGKSVYHENF